MIKVALVGNIACGKSLAQKIIEGCGFKVLDTDEVSHAILETSTEIIDIFKGFDVLNNGKISREKIGKIVFDDKIMLKNLEKVIHPKVRVKIIEFFEHNSTEKVVFVAIPLLFEADMQDLFDKIVFVYADDDLRKSRLIKRNGYSKDYAEKRLYSQVPQEKKIKFCDYVIKNNSTVENFESEIKNLLKELC